MFIHRILPFITIILVSNISAWTFIIGILKGWTFIVLLAMFLITYTALRMSSCFRRNPTIELKLLEKYSKDSKYYVQP